MNPPRRISVLAAVLHAIVLRPLVRLFCGIGVTGGDHLAELDQVIIIANHNSHLDTLLLFYVLPLDRLRRTHPVADRPYFERSPILLHLVDFLFKPIWISRGKPEPESDPLGTAGAVLDAGRSVVVFPEGTRGQAGRMQHFKSGVGRLITRYPEVPIVPVYLSGPEKVLPKASALLLPFWNLVVVGPGRKYTGHHRDITHQLEHELAEMAKSAEAGRHKRRRQRAPLTRSIAFIGIDGSGKSTLSTMAARELSKTERVCHIGDELQLYKNGRIEDLQPLPAEHLRRRISAFAKSASSLKRYKIPKLAELLLRDLLSVQAMRWYRPGLIVMDGSPLLNLLAWSVLYKPEALDRATCSKAIGILSGLKKDIPRRDPIFTRFPELAQMRTLGLTRLALPNIVVLIDVDSATACGRIDRRGEHKQVHETEAKLEPLRRAYLDVCEVIQSDWPVTAATLDGRQPLESVRDHVSQFVSSSLAEDA
jgi:1-acyl-sn-glycerol-3-phosphate acyltransferase